MTSIARSSASGVDDGLLRGRLGLVDELDAAAQVEAELRLLRRDDEERRREEPGDEEQDEEVAPAVGHGTVARVAYAVGREDEQHAAVVVVGREQVGLRLRGQVALGVDLDRLVELADAPLEHGRDGVVAVGELAGRAPRWPGGR